CHVIARAEGSLGPHEAIERARGKRGIERGAPRVIAVNDTQLRQAAIHSGLGNRVAEFYVSRGKAEGITERNEGAAALHGANCEALSAQDARAKRERLARVAQRRADLKQFGGDDGYVVLAGTGDQGEFFDVFWRRRHLCLS